jgi:hypothetical protein
MLLKHVNEYDDSELMLSGPNFMVDDLPLFNVQIKLRLFSSKTLLVIFSLLFIYQRGVV